EQKGFGHGIALLRDYNEDEVAVCMLDLCEEVCRRARTADKMGKTIHLGIRYGKETGGGFSRSMSVHLPTNVTMDVYRVCKYLFRKHYDGISKVRHVYVTLDNLRDQEETQLNLFEDRSKKNDIGFVMDEIRAKYGSTAILRASSYTDAGITLDRSGKIGGHKAYDCILLYLVDSFCKFWDCDYSPPRKKLLLLIPLVDINCDITYRSENTLRFPRAASEPPRARPCGVSLRPLLPQESTCVFSADVVPIYFLSLLLLIRRLFGAEDR